MVPHREIVHGRDRSQKNKDAVGIAMADGKGVSVVRLMSIVASSLVGMDIVHAL